MSSKNIDLTDESIEPLDRFIGGNFHQDWSMDYDSEQAVVAAYRQAGGSLAVDEVVKSIDFVLEGNLTEHELKQLLYHMGLGIEIGVDESPSSWLRGVRENLLGIGL